MNQTRPCHAVRGQKGIAPGDVGPWCVSPQADIMNPRESTKGLGPLFGRTAPGAGNKGGVRDGLRVAVDSDGGTGDGHQATSGVHGGTVAVAAARRVPRDGQLRVLQSGHGAGPAPATPRSLGQGHLCPMPGDCPVPSPCIECSRALRDLGRHDRERADRALDAGGFIERWTTRGHVHGVLSCGSAAGRWRRHWQRPTG